MALTGDEFAFVCQAVMERPGQKRKSGKKIPERAARWFPSFVMGMTIDTGSYGGSVLFTVALDEAPLL
jgi:hypothetical protein